MAETDLDLLIGQLAVHYKVLSKERTHEALLAWQKGGKQGEFGDYLTREGLLAPEMLRKLIKARDLFLKRASSGESAEEPNAVASAPAAGGSLDDTKPTAEARPVVEPGGLQATEPPELELGEPPDLTVATPSPTAEEPVAAPTPTATKAVAPVAAAPEVEESPPAAAAPAPPAASQHLLQFGPETRLEDLLRQACELDASDLHVHSGANLKLRLAGRLQDAGEALESERAETLIRELLNEDQLARLAAENQVDFAYAIPDVGRFRANVYYQQRGLDAVFRVIPPLAPTLADLGLPESFESFSTYHQGIVLFTGPAGCGKSSTMAALVRLVNEKRPEHIITIEDPIEYVHPAQRSVVNQREVGPHTESFARALRAALREDPDVIVIGELRDLETISLALTAAETGHLVFATLHTSSAIRTVNRVLGVFPPDQQAQIRTMFSESLRAVISQRLLARSDGNGRVAALEVLINTRAVGNLIREQKTFQLSSLMQTGASQGMCLLDASLQELVKRRIVSADEARHHAEKPEAIR